MIKEGPSEFNFISVIQETLVDSSRAGQTSHNPLTCEEHGIEMSEVRSLDKVKKPYLADSVENHNIPTTLLSMEFGSKAPMPATADDDYCRKAMEADDEIIVGCHDQLNQSSELEDNFESDDNPTFRNTVSVQDRARQDLLNIGTSKRRLSNHSAFFTSKFPTNETPQAAGSVNTHMEGGSNDSRAGS